MGADMLYLSYYTSRTKIEPLTVTNRNYNTMIEKAGVVIAKKIAGEWYALMVQQTASELWGIPKGSQTNKHESW